MDAPWRNRIVGEGEQPAAQFLAHPLNWRRHPAEQQAALEALLDRVGWVQRVLVSQRSGYMLDGHLRVMSALKRGDGTPIPYSLVDLDPEEEALVLATFDPIALLALADAEQHAQLVGSLAEDDAAIAAMVAGAVHDTEASTVSFEVAERPTCPTCGQKIRVKKPKADEP